MRNKLKIQVLPYLFVLILLSTISCGNWFRSENKVFSENTFYTIDAETILDDLKENKTDVFQQFNGKPTRWTPVEWSTSDYFSVAQALHKLAWGESLNQWKLSIINSNAECVHINSGLRYIRFSYYKEEQGARFMSRLFVQPWENSVSVLKEEYTPVVTNWEEIDLTAIKIPAEEALRIAEENGGANARSTVNNDCTITIVYNPTLFDYDGWEVAYYSFDYDALGRFFVDPYTGEIEDP